MINFLKGWQFGSPQSKKPDSYCPFCNLLMNHKKVKWKKRTFDPTTLSDNPKIIEVSKKIADMTNTREIESSKNRIFGGFEYEYRGDCPECKQLLTAFWFGLDSMLKPYNKEIVWEGKNFFCPECETSIERLQSFVYSKTMINEDEERYEPLVIVCPECQTENGYPFSVDLSSGNIE